MHRLIYKKPLFCYELSLIFSNVMQEIYKDRKKFSKQVFEVASSDLVNMGITVVSYTLKDIRDEEVSFFPRKPSTLFFFCVLVFSWMLIYVRFIQLVMGNSFLVVKLLCLETLSVQTNLRLRSLPDTIVFIMRYKRHVIDTQHFCVMIPFALVHFENYSWFGK